MNILISLHKGYGLGDAVQMSAVLRHVQKYRPEWVVDFQAERGRETVGYGLVRNCFCYGEPYPSSHYDAEVQIVLYDTFANWHDRPNTRVTSCLHERFAIPWDPECGRYEVIVPRDACYEAQAAVSRMTAARWKLDSRIVALHYRGDSAQHQKNLSFEQASAICKCILEQEFTPLLLDWRGEWPAIPGACTTGANPEWGRDARMNCAVIRNCSAYIGIDSGPSKCASSTETPALVIWTGHHPSPFHDPASNTTHLVPVGYHGLQPVCSDPGVIAWFEANYNVRTYEQDPVPSVRSWLSEVIRR